VKLYGRFTLAAIVWGALTFGAVYPWAYWPLVTFCALLGVLGLRTKDDYSGWLRWLAAALALVAVVAVLQLIPLPRAVLLTLSPATDRFLQEYILGYAAQPLPSHPISVAPEQTIRGLVLFVGFSLFLLGVVRGLPLASVENLVRRLTIFAVGLATFAVVQHAASGEDGTQLVYGFWKPRNPGTIFGPFINRNHFAGWMVMAAPLALGLALGILDRSRPRSRNSWGTWSGWLASTDGNRFLLAIIAALAMGASIVISGSRSGMTTFIVSIGVVLIFVWRAFVVRFRSGVLLAVTAIALIAIVFSWAGLEAAVGRFASVSEDASASSRIEAWRDTVRIIRDFPILGVGLNGYGTAMLVYQSGDRRLFYREAHNDYLQILSEGGVVFGLAAVLVIGIIASQVRTRFRERRDTPMVGWIRAGAVASLAGIAAQSLIEFSLQMPGNTTLFLVVVAIAVHRPIRSVRSLAHQRRAA
jgi:putative inorganic carbon (hco3(-)) transporter